MLLCLTSFLHSCFPGSFVCQQVSVFHSFWWPNNIPVVWLVHILFICSSVGGRCLYFVAIMNSAAMNTCVHTCTQWMVFNYGANTPRGGIAGGLRARLCLAFEELSNCFAQWFYAQLLAMCKGSDFSTYSPALVIFCLLVFLLLPSRCEVLWFWFIFPSWLMPLSIFSCACDVSLEKCLFKSLACFLIGLLVFLLLNCIYILDTRPFPNIWFAKTCCRLFDVLWMLFVPPFLWEEVLHGF